MFLIQDETDWNRRAGNTQFVQFLLMKQLLKSLPPFHLLTTLRVIPDWFWRPHTLTEPPRPPSCQWRAVTRPHKEEEEHVKLKSNEGTEEFHRVIQRSRQLVFPTLQSWMLILSHISSLQSRSHYLNPSKTQFSCKCWCDSQQCRLLSGRSNDTICHWTS